MFLSVFHCFTFSVHCSASYLSQSTFHLSNCWLNEPFCVGTGQLVTTSDEGSVCWPKGHTWARRRLVCWLQWGWPRSASTSFPWWLSCPLEMRYEHARVSEKLRKKFRSLLRRLLRLQDYRKIKKKKRKVCVRVQVAVCDNLQCLSVRVESRTSSLFLKRAAVCARAAPESRGWPSPWKD